MLDPLSVLWSIFKLGMYHEGLCSTSSLWRTPMRTSLVMVVAASALIGVACKSSREPPLPVPHPAGNASTQIIGLAGRPFGLNVTTGGDVLVTEQDANRAVHVDSLGG